MQVDLSPIIQPLIYLAGGVLFILAGAILVRLQKWAGVKLTAEQTAQFDDALNKSITFGATKAIGEIKAHGWDSPMVKDQVLATAAQNVVEKFPGALKAVGLTPTLNEPGNAQNIADALERAFPAAMKQAAESPATPPATAPNPPTQAAIPVVAASDTGTTPTAIPAPPVVSKEPSP
jgi:hypothetical protein